MRNGIIDPLTQGGFMQGYLHAVKHQGSVALLSWVSAGSSLFLPLKFKNPFLFL